jgi:hypothetical protein
MLKRPKKFSGTSLTYNTVKKKVMVTLLPLISYFNNHKICSLKLIVNMKKI